MVDPPLGNHQGGNQHGQTDAGPAKGRRQRTAPRRRAELAGAGASIAPFFFKDTEVTSQTNLSEAMLHGPQGRKPAGRQTTGFRHPENTDTRLLSSARMPGCPWPAVRTCPSRGGRDGPPKRAATPLFRRSGHLEIAGLLGGIAASPRGPCRLTYPHRLRQGGLLRLPIEADPFQGLVDLLSVFSPKLEIARRSSGLQWTKSWTVKMPRSSDNWWCGPRGQSRPCSSPAAPGVVSPHCRPCSTECGSHGVPPKDKSHPPCAPPPRVAVLPPTRSSIPRMRVLVRRACSNLGGFLLAF